MDPVTTTWLIDRDRPISLTNHHACLVHIYPTGPGMGTRYMLHEQTVLIGRGPDCDIRVEDYSVSRRHAHLQREEDGYYVIDLQSTNGTYVNDVPTSCCRLQDGDYLRIGKCIYRFLAGGNVEAEYHEEIYRLTIMDALTGIHNKRYLMEFLDRELARSARYQRPLALILFDIDHFKAVNDDLGHLAGDFILHELASRLKKHIRKEELFARYGGEEFAVVLPEVTAEAAVQAAERLRRLVAEQPFCYEGRSLIITISLGVASTCGENDLTPEDLLRRADEKLLAAKSQGRNRLIC